MDDPRHAADDADENFDLDWESLTFSSARSGNGESDSFDDWEERVAQDTRGYEANSATTSFTSPTFTLIHEYRGPETSVFHIDLYRVEKRRELDTLGVDELLTEDKNLLLVEWGEKFAQLVSAADGQIAITRVSDQDRKIKVTHK